MLKLIKKLFSWVKKSRKELKHMLSAELEEYPDEV